MIIVEDTTESEGEPMRAKSKGAAAAARGAAPLPAPAGHPKAALEEAKRGKGGGGGASSSGQQQGTGKSAADPAAVAPAGVAVGAAAPPAGKGGKKRKRLQPEVGGASGGYQGLEAHFDTPPPESTLESWVAAETRAAEFSRMAEAAAAPTSSAAAGGGDSGGGSGGGGGGAGGSFLDDALTQSEGRKGPKANPAAALSSTQKEDPLVLSLVRAAAPPLEKYARIPSKHLQQQQQQSSGAAQSAGGERVRLLVKQGGEAHLYGHPRAAAVSGFGGGGACCGACGCPTTLSHAYAMLHKLGLGGMGVGGGGGASSMTAAASLPTAAKAKALQALGGAISLLEAARAELAFVLAGGEVGEGAAPAAGSSSSSSSAGAAAAAPAASTSAAAAGGLWNAGAAPLSQSPFHEPSMVGESQQGLQPLSVICSQASYLEVAVEGAEEAPSAAAATAAAAAAAPLLPAGVTLFIGGLPQGVRAALDTSRPDWRDSLCFIHALQAADLAQGVERLKESLSGAESASGGSGGLAERTFLAFAERQLRMSAGSPGSAGACSPGALLDMLEEEVGQQAAAQSVSAARGGGGSSSSSGSSAAAAAVAPGALVSPGFDSMASPELHSWAQGFGLRVSGRDRGGLVADVRDAFVAGSEEGGTGAPTPAAAAAEGGAVAPEGAEWSTSAPRTGPERLAQAIKGSPSLYEAVLFMQPIPLRLLKALAKEAGLDTENLEADLKQLKVLVSQAYV